MATAPTFDELCRWKEEHPSEELYACAKFLGQVHLSKYINRSWVETHCGLTGTTKLHALVFKLPRQAVDCEKCKALAKL